MTPPLVGPPEQPLLGHQPTATKRRACPQARHPLCTQRALGAVLRDTPQLYQAWTTSANGHPAPDRVGRAHHPPLRQGDSNLSLQEVQDALLGDPSAFKELDFKAQSAPRPQLGRKKPFQDRNLETQRAAIPKLGSPKAFHDLNLEMQSFPKIHNCETQSLFKT